MLSYICNKYYWKRGNNMYLKVLMIIVILIGQTPIDQNLEESVRPCDIHCVFPPCDNI